MEKITLTLLKTPLQVGVFVHKVQLAKINTINLKFQISKQSKIETHKETNTNTNLIKRKKKIVKKRRKWKKKRYLLKKWVGISSLTVSHVFFSNWNLIWGSRSGPNRYNRERERRDTKKLSLSLSHLIVIFNQTHC